MSTNPIRYSSILESLQEDIAFFLAGKPEFKDIPVLTFLKGNLERRLQLAMDTQLGVCVLVMQPLPYKVVSNIPGPAFEEVSFKVRVMENLASNDSGRSALFLAERISQYLHLLELRTEGWHSSLSLVDTQPWVEVKDTRHPSRNILELSFVAYTSL